MSNADLTGRRPISQTLAALSLTVLAIFIMSIYLPMLYEKLFIHRVGKTHLLFSPITKEFVYTEKIVGKIPPESIAAATDHTAEYAYRSQHGRWYKRVEFERLLPFIYYKNMELWKMLPIEIDGRIFDRDTIKNNRQVWELKHQEFNQTENLWPLIEPENGEVRLSFPKDRFRMTDKRMEFINIYRNQVDEKLSNLFTAALKDRGFKFPARSVNGKFTVLKPFDEGVFLVDADFAVFHLKRRDGLPVIVRTGIDPNLETAIIKITENKKRDYYGLLVSKSGKLYLISYDNYRLIPLPLDNYDHQRMDFKLIMNPIYNTAIYSDDKMVYGLAMDKNFRPISSYSHQMSRAKKTTADRIYAVLFPFYLKLDNQQGLKIHAASGGLPATLGIAASILCLIVWSYWQYWQYRKRPKIFDIFLVGVSGIYGLIFIIFVGKHE
ncbi:MAG: hypothetical protein CSB24_02005 [Deltaproteobacteria bacterium]|nr:MAG: hypothetical protein CSB24_02005 [Deltaproteobacteria bacterium]